MNDAFSLFDLEVSVTGDPTTFVCSHKPGYAFSVIGENLTFVENHQFSLYALGALLPLLPAKQRATHENDWMTTDDYVHCPDPHCGAQFKISRTSKTEFHHADVTRVPLPEKESTEE
jgi:uncharacterized repeat protein (TIGR04076 family)